MGAVLSTLPTSIILVGDCVEEMAKMPADSVGAVVCDPPYDLLQTSRNGSQRINVGKPGNPYAGGAARAGGFMGKPWDATGVAFQVETWAEAFRVLKPGAYLLAFGGTRTAHRMVCAIEDAGFEIRDSLHWIYGSGFPKSLDVSKAIDKTGGKSIAWFGPWLRQERERRGITQKELAKHFPSKTGGLTGCVANWELSLNVPTVEQFNILCDVLDLPFDRLEEAKREVVGKHPSPLTESDTGRYQWNVSGNGRTDANITAPATEEAQRWQGWGTALKPAHEPIVMARKPLSQKNVAQNVLAHGTGAINVDGCRVGTAEALQGSTVRDDIRGGGFANGHKPNPGDIPPFQQNTSGRWPPNLLLSHHPDCNGECVAGCPVRLLGEPGRFFPRFEGEAPFRCVAKASRRERNGGLEGMPEHESRRYGDRSQGPLSQQTPQGAIQMQNGHPTVKPIALMRWLVRLVTPPGGTVLDPFMGSGSTGCAAVQEGFNFIGIEQDSDYALIAEKRISYWSGRTSTATTEVAEFANPTDPTFTGRLF